MAPEEIPGSVVLLHGWGGRFDNSFAACGWADAIAGHGRRVIGIDLPGHGLTPQSHDPSDYADLAGAVLNSLPAEPVDMIGFSLGAKVMLDIALREPGRVRTLIAGGIGDNVFAPENNIAPVTGWLVSNDPRGAPPPLQAVMAQILDDGHDPRALAAILQRPPNPVFDEARLKALRHPLHLIVGEQDQVAGTCERLRRAVPQATETRLPGVGHFDLLAAPGFRKAVLALLMSTDAAAASRPSPNVSTLSGDRR